MMEKVPFIDLNYQTKLIKKNVLNQWNKILDNSSFVLSEDLKNFEDKFSQYSKVEYSTGVGNGGDAIEFLLRSLRLSKNSTVYLPVNTFIATATAVSRAGYKIKFVDVNQSDGLMSYEALLNYKIKKIDAIIPVHLFGSMLDIKELKNNLDSDVKLLEDASQAHGATFRSDPPGKHSYGATYSFYPGKNLGAMGDAGALITNDLALYEKSAKFARHGGLIKGKHEIEGINSRMDGLQAAVLSIKAKYLRDWNSKRRENATIYKNGLSILDKYIDIPFQRIDTEHVWHLYVIKTEFRDELSLWLKRKGIQTAINYPVSLPFLEAYKRFKFKPNDFPNAYHNQNKILSLPMYPELTNSDINYVIESIKKFPKFNFK